MYDPKSQLPCNVHIYKTQKLLELKKPVFLCVSSEVSSSIKTSQIDTSAMYDAVWVGEVSCIYQC